MRKFAIELNEWYKKDVDRTDIGHTIKKLEYELSQYKNNSTIDMSNSNLSRENLFR